METPPDFQKLTKVPLLKLTRVSSSNVSGTDPEIEGDEPRYTSLKDLLLSSSSSSSLLPYHALINQEANSHNEFDSSKIFIRNRLVKSAASAYLQSAAILVNRDENCLLNLWGKLKNNLQTCYSCCNVYFRDFLEACFLPIYQFLTCAWDRIISSY